MIGMNSLGKNGRLGNQMFQYAALVGIAKNRNFDYCIPDHTRYNLREEFEDSTGRSKYHQLHKVFKLSNLNGRYGEIDGDIVEVHQHHFCRELFDECPDQVTLYGHFESYHYFQNAVEELKHDFEFLDDLLEESSKFHTQNNLNSPVSICVRRGDFLLFPDCHPVCSEEYYNYCIQSIGKDRQYVIVSDDIEWCKSQEIFKGNNFYFVDNIPSNFLKSSYDMCVSSLCDDFIISNSTFSWWISWLGSNKNKTVYTPDPWFGNQYKDFNTEGYYPEYTVKVKRSI
jgi:hypothetical protein